MIWLLFNIRLNLFIELMAVREYVKFNLNKGTASNKSTFATIKNLSVEGDECHILDIELYRAGYTHTGWNTKANGTVTHRTR